MSTDGINNNGGSMQGSLVDPTIDVPNTASPEAGSGEGSEAHLPYEQAPAPTIPLQSSASASRDGFGDERTVVGQIPRELIADSARVPASTSGLGRFLGARGSSPFNRSPASRDEGNDVDVAFDDDVVTSAPDVLRRGGAPAPEIVSEGYLEDGGLESAPPSRISGPPPLPMSSVRPGPSLGPPPLPTAPRFSAGPPPLPAPRARSLPPPLPVALAADPPPAPVEPSPLPPAVQVPPTALDENAIVDVIDPVSSALILSPHDDELLDVAVEPVLDSPAEAAVELAVEIPVEPAVEPVLDSPAEAAVELAVEIPVEAVVEPDVEILVEAAPESIEARGALDLADVVLSADLAQFALSSPSDTEQFATPPVFVASPPIPRAPEAGPVPQVVLPAPSLAPPPPEPSVSPWGDERDASRALLDVGKLDRWEQRAAWFAEEAAARENADDRARILLAVSELHAMASDDEKTVAVASAARDAAPSNPLLHRQARGVALRDRNWQDVIVALDAETLAASTPEARCHGALIRAELAGRVQLDSAAMLAHLDHAHQALPSDPRPIVGKLVQALVAHDNDLPALSVPEIPELASLRAAAEETRRIRSASNGGTDAQDASSVYEAIPRARAALRSFDTASASKFLRLLQPVRALGSGAAWLSATLAAQKAESRTDALAWLGELGAGTHAPMAVRMRALRAAESGRADIVQEALAASPGDAAFAAADRVALGALFFDSSNEIQPFLVALAKTNEHKPLAWAATSVLLPVRGDDSAARAEAPLPGPDAARDAVAIARAVVSGLPAARVGALAGSLLESNSDALAPRLLRIDCELSERRADHLVEEIAGWGADQNNERDRCAAAALIAELLGDLERSQAEYTRASVADPSWEAAARALVATSPSEAPSARLLDLARTAEDDAKGAVLLLEAALRLVDPAAASSALRQSFDRAPNLPFAAWIGERMARERGDLDAALEWIRTRSGRTEDPVEAAYDLCREAMVMLERDPSAASTLLARASAARPQDVALRALYERFAIDRPDDRVAWRLEQGAGLDLKGRARMLWEAAIDLERAGKIDDAAKAARQAAETGVSELANRCLERCAAAGASTPDITDALLQVARSDDATADRRREACERLADIDTARGDQASALLWHRSILEASPGHLPSLRRLEHALVGSGREDDFEPIASELVRVLEGPEVDAHAVAATRVRLRESSWASTRDLCDAAAKLPNPSLWALRNALAHARSAGDLQGVIDAATALAQRGAGDSESAALLALAGEAFALLGKPQQAVESLQSALSLEPAMLGAHRRLIDLLADVGDSARAAEECEALARKSQVPDHQVALWYRAAVLWLDHVQAHDRGRVALEEASALDVAFADVFDRLKALYLATSDTNQLALLLEKRLEVVVDPAERLGMQVLRARVLAGVGETAAAKDVLVAALEASPDNLPALEAFADISFDDADWANAEQALARLATLTQDVEAQAGIYRKLSVIYLDHRPDYELAEVALREVLSRNPGDQETQSRLVDVFRQAGDAPKAIALCTTLIEQAATPEEKRRRTIQLALIHEQVEGDAKKAEQMLDKLYKQSPSSIVALKALAEFYSRRGQEPALNLLLDRASNDARRALRTGRFNRELFDVVEAVATLRGNASAALAAKAAISAMEGGAVELDAAGPRAFDTSLDDTIAPDLLTTTLRALLQNAGHLLDAAFPMDLTSFRAGPLPRASADLHAAILSAAANFALTGLEVLVSPALGPTCVPVSSSPPCIVLGAALAASPDDGVRNFLVLRALKIVQIHGCVLSRTAPIDLLPLVAAFVKLFVPGFTPAGIDPKRHDDAVARLRGANLSDIEPSTAALAAEFAKSLDNRASALNVAVNGWGDRVALLATGRLEAAIQGIAFAGGHPAGPPAGAKERTTWIGRNAEARDLVIFLASAEFHDACERLGIA